MTEDAADRTQTGPADAEPGGVTSPPSTHEALREAVTMALYVSLSLLAVLLATPRSVEESSPELALTVALTAVALVLAHQIAFRLSTRLLNRGLLDSESLRLLGAQTFGGVSVVVLAAVPVLVLGAPGLRVSSALLILLVATVGYLTARSVPVSRPRALLYVGVVVMAVVLLLAVKSLIGH